MTKFKNRYRIESARRPGWDYRSAGWYFVTICTAQRRHFFGDVIDGVMHLSPVGETADAFFQAIPDHTRAICQVDTYQIMPNHAHGIIVVKRPAPVETLHCNVSTINADSPMAAIAPKAGSLSAIIRSYKSAVSYWCRENGYPHFGWQTRFHDHIIRNERALNTIRAYIRNNPANWAKDRDNEPGLYM